MILYPFFCGLKKKFAILRFFSAFLQGVLTNIVIYDIGGLNNKKFCNKIYCKITAKVLDKGAVAIIIST